MDIRTKRTKSAIINAFIELRSQKPIEKISIKELSDLAGINKATFYRHYEDIYALTDNLENELITDALNNLPENLDLLSSESIPILTQIMSSQSGLFTILFSGSRKDAAIEKLHEHIMEKVCNEHPEFKNDLEKRITLSAIILGSYHAYFQYRNSDMSVLIRSLSKLNNLLSV